MGDEKRQTKRNQYGARGKLKLVYALYTYSIYIYVCVSLSLILYVYIYRIETRRNSGKRQPNSSLSSFGMEDCFEKQSNFPFFFRFSCFRIDLRLPPIFVMCF